MVHVFPERIASSLLVPLFELNWSYAVCCRLLHPIVLPVLIHVTVQQRPDNLITSESELFPIGSLPLTLVDFSVVPCRALAPLPVVFLFKVPFSGLGDLKAHLSDDFGKRNGVIALLAREPTRADPSARDLNDRWLSSVDESRLDAGETYRCDTVPGLKRFCSWVSFNISTRNPESEEIIQSPMGDKGVSFQLEFSYYCEMHLHFRPKIFLFFGYALPQVRTAVGEGNTRVALTLLHFGCVDISSSCAGGKCDGNLSSGSANKFSKKSASKKMRSSSWSQDAVGTSLSRRNVMNWSSSSIAEGFNGSSEASVRVAEESKKVHRTAKGYSLRCYPIHWLWWSLLSKVIVECQPLRCYRYRSNCELLFFACCFLFSVRIKLVYGINGKQANENRSLLVFCFTNFPILKSIDEWF